MQVLTPLFCSHKSNSFIVLVTDVNECVPDQMPEEYGHLENNCHVDANCTNTKGSFYCTCHLGYSGDGVSCVGMSVEKQQIVNPVIFFIIMTLEWSVVPIIGKCERKRKSLHHKVCYPFDHFRVVASYITHGCSNC